MNTLVTGATGFVGKAVITALTEQCFCPIAVVRSTSTNLPDSVKQIEVDNIQPDTDWSGALNHIDVIIHLAARVHVMNDTVANPLNEFRFHNKLSTINLARQAADKGVERFIYLSSIKVNGESTLCDIPFEPDDKFIPTDSYGLSKYEAEQALLQLAQETSMEVVIIRPPLVYGPCVKANFESMLYWIDKGWPLPFGVVHNVRSLVALDNLVSFIIHCIDHPKAANEVFLISDGEDVSTTELLRLVAKALGKKHACYPYRWD